MNTTVKTVRNIAVLLLLLFILTLTLFFEEAFQHSKTVEGINVFKGYSVFHQFLQYPVILLLIFSVGFIWNKSNSNNAVIIGFSERIYLPLSVSLVFNTVALIAFEYGYYAEGLLLLFAQLISLLLLNDAIQFFFKRYFLDEYENRILTIPYGLYLGLNTVVLLTAINHYIMLQYNNDSAVLSLLFLVAGLFFFAYYLFRLKNVAATIPLSWSVLGISRHINHQHHYAEYIGKAVIGVIMIIMLLYIIMIWLTVRKRFQSN